MDRSKIRSDLRDLSVNLHKTHKDIGKKIKKSTESILVIDRAFKQIKSAVTGLKMSVVGMRKKRKAAMSYCMKIYNATVIK